MRQQSHQGRDQEQEVEEEARKQRRIMTQFEEQSPQPSPLDLLHEPQEEHDEIEHTTDSEFSSELDSDEEIVICPHTNKFDRKPPVSQVRLPRAQIRPNSRTNCDQQGDGPTTQLDDDESIQSTRQRSQLLSQLATVTTTTLSPSPTPRPFCSPSPPLSQSEEEEEEEEAEEEVKGEAIDSTATTTQTYSPFEEHPFEHQQDDHRPVLSSLNRRLSSNPIRPSKSDLDYLDALLESINDGNLAAFRKLIHSAPEADKSLFNVFIRGRTLLHHALKCGRGLEWCKILVEKGADPNLSDTYGWHPLHLAAAHVSGSVTSFIADCC